MADQIKLDTIGLGQMLIAVSQLENEVKSTQGGVVGVINSLDWEGGFSRAVEENLNNIGNELVSQAETLGEIRSAFQSAITMSDGFNEEFIKEAAGIITAVISVLSTFFPASKNGAVQTLTGIKDWLRKIETDGVLNVVNNRGKGSDAEYKLDMFIEGKVGNSFPFNASGGVGCCAFAKSALIAMYGSSSFGATCNKKTIEGLSNSKEIMNEISVGDVIHFYRADTKGEVLAPRDQHWFVIKSWNESGLTVYESSGDMENVVKVSTYPWKGGNKRNSSIANFFGTESKKDDLTKFDIYHAKNYS